MSALLERFDNCPPFLVYYASHLGLGKRLTVDQLARQAKLSRRTIVRTARKLSWATVKIGVADKFCRACGVDPIHPDELLKGLAAELQSEVPFTGLKGHRRKRMIAQFNILSAKAALARSGRA